MTLEHIMDIEMVSAFYLFTSRGVTHVSSRVNNIPLGIENSCEVCLEKLYNEYMAMIA